MPSSFTILKVADYLKYFFLDYILCREDLTESFTLIIVIKRRLQYIFPILPSLPWMVQK